MSTVRRHFAWFSRDSGQWVGEWAGTVPAAEIPLTASREERYVLMNEWTMNAIALISTGSAETEAEMWDWRALDDCQAGSLVCLDVTRFQWPVGDHVWHRWDDHERALDWGEEHLFIEINMNTMEVVANQSSHRPIRDSVPGQRVLDITGSDIAVFHGHLFGTFVRTGHRWSFLPRDLYGRRSALTESSSSFDIDFSTHVPERSVVRR